MVGFDSFVAVKVLLHVGVPLLGRVPPLLPFPLLLFELNEVSLKICFFRSPFAADYYSCCFGDDPCFDAADEVAFFRFLPDDTCFPA